MADFQAQFDEQLPSNTTVLRLRGLPFSATEDEVRAFFGSQHPLDPAPGSVVIVTQGFHRGEGYVRFLTAEACAAAHRALNRAHLGGRYIELYASTEGALDLQRSAQDHLLSEKRYYVRLRGLPFQAGEGNVREFMSPLGAGAVLSVHMCIGPDTRFNGNAFVELSSEDNVRKALENLQRRSMGSRYIELFESTALERDAALNAERRRRRHQSMASSNHMAGAVPNNGHPSAKQQGGDGRPGEFSGHSGGTGNFEVSQPSFLPAPPRPSYPVIRMRGLPYTANESTIADFLAGVNIPAQGVHMVYNANERPTGEAFVEVCSEADVQAALALNHHTLGKRYIEVFRSSQGEMLRLQMGEAVIPEGSFYPHHQAPSPSHMPQQHHHQHQNYSHNYNPTFNPSPTSHPTVSTLAYANAATLSAMAAHQQSMQGYNPFGMATNLPQMPPRSGGGYSPNAGPKQPSPTHNDGLVMSSERPPLIGHGW
jgi:heterogeneous nuclear ribonucleoprotein F/H